MLVRFVGTRKKSPTLLFLFAGVFGTVCLYCIVPVFPVYVLSFGINPLSLVDPFALFPLHRVWQPRFWLIILLPSPGKSSGHSTAHTHLPQLTYTSCVRIHTYTPFGIIRDGGYQGSYSWYSQWFQGLHLAVLVRDGAMAY